MKNLFAFVLMLASITSYAQKYFCDNGNISFFSKTAMENISADNKHVISLFNSDTNEIVFSVAIVDFKFDRSLMEEHFNEKYMESEKYPKATFQGKVTGFAKPSIDVQQVKAIGKLTIHGVSHDVEIPGTLQNVNGNWILKTKFIVKLADYKVEIPQLLWQNIAEQVDITVDMNYHLQQQKI